LNKFKKEDTPVDSQIHKFLNIAVLVCIKSDLFLFAVIYI